MAFSLNQLDKAPYPNVLFAGGCCQLCWLVCIRSVCCKVPQLLLGFTAISNRLWPHFLHWSSNLHLIVFCCFVTNAPLAGDMNWTDSRDGTPPLPPGWRDCWQALHPGDPGFTYDSHNNPMLAYKNPGLRLDRCVSVCM